MVVGKRNETNSIEVQCPACGRKANLKVEFAGRDVECSCGEIFVARATPEKPDFAKRSEKVRAPFSGAQVCSEATCSQCKELYDATSTKCPRCHAEMPAKSKAETVTAGLNLISEYDAVNDVSEQHKDKPHSDTSPRNRQFINRKTNEAKRQANSVSVRCPACGHQALIRAKFAGRDVECVCGEIFAAAVPTVNQYYFKRGEIIYGPFDETHAKELIKAQTITLDDETSNNRNGPWKKIANTGCSITQNKHESTVLRSVDTTYGTSEPTSSCSKHSYKDVPKSESKATTKVGKDTSFSGLHIPRGDATQDVVNFQRAALLAAECHPVTVLTELPRETPCSPTHARSRQLMRLQNSMFKSTERLTRLLASAACSFIAGMFLGPLLISSFRFARLATEVFFVWGNGATLVLQGADVVFGGLAMTAGFSTLAVAGYRAFEHCVTRSAVVVMLLGALLSSALYNSGEAHAVTQLTQGVTVLLLVLESGNLLTCLASLERNRLLVHATPLAIIACMHLVSIAVLAFSWNSPLPNYVFSHIPPHLDGLRAYSSGSLYAALLVTVPAYILTSSIVQYEEDESTVSHFRTSASTSLIIALCGTAGLASLHYLFAGAWGSIPLFDCPRAVLAVELFVVSSLRALRSSLRL